MRREGLWSGRAVAAVVLGALLLSVAGPHVSSASPAGGSRIELIADARVVPAGVRKTLATRLANDLSRLSRFYGFYLRGNVRFVLASSTGEFARAADGVAGDVLAVARAQTRTIVVSPASWRGDPSRAASVLTHEASHLVLGAKFAAARAPLPKWLNEGMAQYVANDWEFDMDFSAQQERLMRGAVAANRVSTLSELDKLFEGSGSDVRLAYAQSYSFISWLASTYGEEALRRFVDSGARSDGTDEAARQVYGVGLGGLQDAWHKSVERGTAWLEVLLESNNFYVFLWSSLAVLVTVGFIVATTRKRRAYADMDEEGGEDSDRW